MKFLGILAFLILILSNCYSNDIEPPKPPLWEIFTLYGVDSDGDEVRDDVELWIDQKFQDLNMRMALKKIAVSYNRLMRFRNDKDKYLEEKTNYDIRNYCWRFVTLNLGSLSSNILLELEEKILNTPVRSYFFRKGFSNLPTGLVRVPDVKPHMHGVGCEFKIINPRKILTQFLKEHPRYQWDDKEEKEFEDVYEKKTVVIDPYSTFKSQQR